MEQTPPLYNKEIPRVYFAGKVGRPNYRHTLGLKSRDMTYINKLHHHGERPYIYGGPIVPSCDHGCWHFFFDGCTGFDGGYVYEDDQSYYIEPSNHDAIVGATMKQIQLSDFLFAWFDSYDAYGSMAEIGFAAGSGIPVYIGFREDVFPIQKSTTGDSWDDQKGHLIGRELWYVSTIAHRSFLAQAPRVAFTRALRCHSKGSSDPEWKNILNHNVRFVFPGTRR